jgi:large subunit ribosomal protein L22
MKIKTDEHSAIAKSLNLPISTKHSIEISHHIRFRSVNYAKKFLEEVIALKKAVPFRRFDADVGHKKGISAGRFPKKAAACFLKLIKGAEANAQNKGLNTSSLKIIKLIPNKASVPLTGGRHRQGTKRTHLEIEVKEMSSKRAAKTKDVKKNEVKSEVKTGAEVKTEVKPEVKKDEAKSEVVSVDTEKPEVKNGVESEKIETVKEEVEETVKEEVKSVVVDEKSESIIEEPKVEKVPEVEKAEPVTEEIKAGANVESVAEEKEADFIVPEVKETSEELESSIEESPVEELSSADLLKQAQAKADELNKKGKQSKDVENVSKLYDQLKKEGTLRKTK